MGTSSSLFYEKLLHLVRGEGVWLYENEGRKYLDVYNNVPHVGQCNPRITFSRHTKKYRLSATLK